MPSSSTSSPISSNAGVLRSLPNSKTTCRVVETREELSALKENNNRSPSYPKSKISGNLGAFKNENLGMRHAMLSQTALFE